MRESFSATATIDSTAIEEFPIARVLTTAGRSLCAGVLLTASLASQRSFAATAPSASAPYRAPAEPITSTVAGTGARGIANGGIATATFMVPVGIAAAPDGSLVVADAAAQNVRRIALGRVTTLAGSAPQGMTPDERAGGFADGPATVARFDRPVGVAVAKNGDVFVADAGNRCIRKISHGMVTTFAGSRAPGHADGDPRIAQFDDLQGIAIDDQGTLFVADYGVGIRRIDAAGNVATITRPGDPKTVLDVAVRGSGSRAILAYSDEATIHVLALGRAQDIAYVADREPTPPETPIGHANGIAILNANTLALVDTATSAVRLLRLPAPPYVSDRMSRSLAGGMREGYDLTGGFADGPPERALLQMPRGIALMNTGVIVVADTGNRRIRAIAGIDPRESLLPGEAPALPTTAYRIVVVGNSYAFFNVLWPESIPGRIEWRLAQDAARLELRRPAALAVYRVDDLTAAGGASLVREYLGDGQADLVILLLNAYGPWTVEELQALEAGLATEGTKLMVVYTPQGYEVSPLDFPAGSIPRNSDFSALHAAAVGGQAFYDRTGIDTVLLLDRMEGWEAKAERKPLFYASDHHFTIFGSQWVGERIAEELERWQPWRSRPT